MPPLVLDGTNGVSGVDGTASNPAIEGTDSNTGIFYPAADTVAIGTGGTERLRVDSSGRLLLGTSTAGSNQGMTIYNATQGELRLQNATTGNGVADGFQLAVNGSDAYVFNRENAPLYFGTNDQTRMTLDSSGRLLIGDTTSRSNFAIGQAQVQIASASFSTFSMFGNGNNSDGSYIALSKARGGTLGGTTAVQSGDILGGIFFEGYNGTGFATGAQIYTRVDGTVSGSQMPGRIEFYTTPTGSNSAVERARISAAGGFMVGMNNFTGSLSNGVGFGVDPVGYMQVIRNQDPPIVACRTVSTGAIINLAYGSTNTNGVVLGNISTNGSTISYNPSSDRRLKEDIQPMRDALTAVMKLKPVTYKWKNTGIADDGFIAQDLLETSEFTHRVNSIGKAEDESDIYGVDYMKFVSVLTAAIQELNAKVEAQAAEIAALKGTT